jgi:hypothetical protein
MSQCTVAATEREEHGDFRIWQPLQILEWESSELEIDCNEVQAKLDVRVKEMIPILRPFNQQWTMSTQFGDEWYQEFMGVRIKDSDPIDQVKLGTFVANWKLECRHSPLNVFPWAGDGITKCRINEGKWEFFHSSFDDSSKQKR